MSDRVELRVDGKKVEDFLSYEVESDLFTAADAFSLELADPGVDIKAGARCMLYVNGALELNGIIDSVDFAYDKGGSRLAVEGRDLMGLLVDSYCEEFPTLENKDLRGLAGDLLKDIPYRKDIIYGRGDKNRAVELSKQEEEFEFAQLRPGETVFDVLKDYATARGLFFFSMPDGTLVFGQPRTSGKAEFSLTHQEGNTNVLSGRKVEDISGQYSKIKVMGQSQGSELWEAEELNFSAYVTNPAVPFYKPFVVVAEYDGKDAKNYARMLMEKQQFSGYRLEYKVPGHSQAGRNWQVNAIAHVRDDSLGVNGRHLIYSRSFRRAKDEGSTTVLKLSRLGVRPA